MRISHIHEAVLISVPPRKRREVQVFFTAFSLFTIPLSSSKLLLVICGILMRPHIAIVQSYWMEVEKGSDCMGDCTMGGNGHVARYSLTKSADIHKMPSFLQFFSFSVIKIICGTTILLGRWKTTG